MLCVNVFRSIAIEMGDLAGEVEVKPTLVDITFLAPKVSTITITMKSGQQSL
jgi:hypothetical protein